MSKKTDVKEDYGYYFYPERSGSGNQKTTFWSTVFGNDDKMQQFKCEKKVLWCIKEHPLVKLLMGALHSHGCDVNLRRHISCEPCLENVNGGYDPSVNQVVVCQNNVSQRVCCNVLAHELVHMFDFCRAKADFKNLEHLACTEIRAANFMHCSFLSAMSAGEAHPFDMRTKHSVCVRRKAILSVLMVRNVSWEEAGQVVDKVFDKCYNDLEPIGRRPRKGSREADFALAEGCIYGYS